jgi:hypothetical protein
MRGHRKAKLQRAKRVGLLGGLPAKGAGFFDFGGEFLDAGDDAALFGESWKWDLYFKKTLGL